MLPIRKCEVGFSYPLVRLLFPFSSRQREDSNVGVHLKEYDYSPKQNALVICLQCPHHRWLRTKVTMKQIRNAPFWASFWLFGGGWGAPYKALGVSGDLGVLNSFCGFN